MFLERVGIFDGGTVSSFFVPNEDLFRRMPKRLSRVSIIPLRILCNRRYFDISSDEQPFVPFRANQFVIVSGESMGKFIAGTRLTANIRACVSVASSQSTAGLGEL